MSGADLEGEVREGYKRVQLGPKEVEIPVEWEIKPVTELFDIRKEGYSPSDTDEPVWLYSMPAFDDEQEPIQTTAKEIGSKKYHVPNDTILFPKLNIRKRRFWRVQHNHDETVVCSTEFWPLIPPTDLCLDYYQIYFNSSVFMRNPKVSTSSSTNSHKRVKEGSFNRVKLPVPPQPEQRRIAAVLSLSTRKFGRPWRSLRRQQRSERD